MMAKRGLCHSQDLRKLKKAYILLKNRYLVVFNPLNLPYQGDFKKQYVSPKLFNGVQIW